MNERPRIPIRPYSKQELQQLYGISRKTLQAWLIRAGIYSDQNRHKSILTIIEIEQLFQTVGHPEPAQKPPP